MSNFKISAYEEILMFIKIQKVIIENKICFNISCGFSIWQYEDELKTLNNMLLALTEGKQFFIGNERSNQEFLNKLISERNEEQKYILEQYYLGNIEKLIN